jgi:hypothetical protein
MKVYSFDFFKNFCLKYNKAPNQMSPSKKKLTDEKIELLYNKYINKEEKKSERQEIKVEKKKIEEDKLKAIYSEVDRRDKFSCQLYKLLSFNDKQKVDKELYGDLKKLDHCHILGKGTNPQLKYDVDNIVLLYRLFHSRLDMYKNPITGDNIDNDTLDYFWELIVGKERYNRLKNKAVNVDLLM